MSPQPIRRSLSDVDMSPRFASTQTVAGSPAAAVETIIATLTLPTFNDVALVSGVSLQGWAAFTVGTNGTAATLQIKRTNAAGTVIASSGATTVTAANLVERSVIGFDTGAGVGVYVLTLTVANGSAASTVSAVSLSAVEI